MTETEQRILELKAHGYDLSARIQHLERQLMEVNRQIAILYQASKNGQPEPIETVSDVVS